LYSFIVYWIGKWTKVIGLLNDKIILKGWWDMLYWPSLFKCWWYIKDFCIMAAHRPENLQIWRGRMYVGPAYTCVVHHDHSVGLILSRRAKLNINANGMLNGKVNYGAEGHIFLVLYSGNWFMKLQSQEIWGISEASSYKALSSGGDNFRIYQKI